jgi:uncharacterized protein YoaH (UPF0181 family)
MPPTRGPAAGRSRYTEDERRVAVEQARALMTEQGYSQNKATDAVGDDLGVSGRTVKLWAADLDMPLGELSREAAKEKIAAAAAVMEATRDYTQAERLALLNEGFDKARTLLAELKTAQEFQQWTVGTGTLIDKRRLEEGKATERLATTDQREAVERAKQHLRSITGGRAG